MKAYTLGIWLYGLGLKLAAWFHPKARAWVRGRREGPSQMEAQLAAYPSPRIWMHCASLGEFEQGRPVLEALREHYPNYAVVLSFFSPSGYEIRKNYTGAGVVTYLPLDLPKQVDHFVGLIQPELAIFVKYELWLHTLAALRRRHIPTLLISARPRTGSAWFRWPLRRWYIPALAHLTAIFAQDQRSWSLLQEQVPKGTHFLGGDTRYDRVAQTQARFQPMAEIQAFVEARPCLVAGSIWPADERILMPVLLEHLQTEPGRCAILAPHEIDPAHLDQWCTRYPDLMIRYSALDQRKESHRLLWIDNIGMLGRLYAYADMAYVGGAFGKGLHNILEAAVFGVPVIFGPHIDRFPEASALIQAGGGLSIRDQTDLRSIWQQWDKDPAQRSQAGAAAADFVQKQVGATAQILDFITQKGLLRSV